MKKKRKIIINNCEATICDKCKSKTIVLKTIPSKTQLIRLRNCINKSCNNTFYTYENRLKDSIDYKAEKQTNV